MKRLFFTLSLAALAFSCTKTEQIPDPAREKEPQPVVSLLEKCTCPFRMEDMLYKADARTKNTFIESYKGTTGYYMCIGPDGQPKWNDWVPVTTLPSREYYNKTVFDIASDGSVIDCFNVLNEATGAQIPYIQKINADGTPAWGKDGIHFYTFLQDLAHPVPPCEGFVAADHNGGAWIAAGSSADSIVLARVDRDGRFSKMLKFDSKGTLGEKTYVSRPQMMVGENDELFLLLQYANLETTLYDGYYDLVKISPDGEILSRETLMPQREFSRGIFGQICPDGRGGAYVVLDAPKNGRHHTFVEHFNAQGKIDFKEVDLLPEGASGNVYSSCSAVEHESGKCVVVMLDNTSVRSYLYAQTVDLQGHVLIGEDSDPLQLLKTEDYVFLSGSQGFKLIPSPTDGRLHLYYVLTKGQRYPLLKTFVLSTEGKISDERNVVDLDVTLLSDGYEDSVNAVIDGNLRFWWLKNNSFNYYSYSDKL